MNSSNLLNPTTPAIGSTPAISTPMDAEVDVELLRSVPKQFCIDSEQSASWLVRKIVQARHYADRVKAWAEQEVRRAAREEQTLMFLFGHQLQDWAKTEISKFEGKRKSLALPSGTVGYRTVASKLVIDDEQVVLNWAKDHCPPALVTVQKLAKSVLNEHFQATGELPDEGAHVEPGGERFYLK